MATDYPIRYTGTIHPMMVKKSLEYATMDHLHDVSAQPSTNVIFVTRHAINVLQAQPEYHNAHIRLYEIEESDSNGPNTTVQFTITGDAPYYGVGVEPNFGIHRFVASGKTYGTDCSISDLRIVKH
jgi:hypothetical protein